MLALLSVLSGESLSSKDLSEHANANKDQYTRQNVADSYNNNSGNSSDTRDSKLYHEQVRNKSETKSENNISGHEQERKQLKEELQFHREEYRHAKADFLEIRNQIRAGKLEPNSEEALNATRIYLNSSINYMIAHLSNVKSNMEASNGNGTKEKVIAIDEKIKLLEAERAEIANASSQEDFVVAVRSVRSVWNNAQKTTLSSAGQTVSEKLGQFLEKSEKLSIKIEAKIENLNEYGIDTADLEAKLASYNSFIKSAKEKKDAADSIYDSENVTQENMEKANNYLRQSLGDISKANKILRQIFGELKIYEAQLADKQSRLDNNESANSENNNSSAVNIIHVKNKEKASRTAINSISGDQPGEKGLQSSGGIKW